MLRQSEREWYAAMVAAALFFMVCGAIAYKIAAWVFSHITITWG